MISLPVSKEVTTTTTTYEQREVNGEFDLSSLANRSYHADKGEYLGGYVDDGEGHALGFHFEGWVDPDKTVDNGDALVLEAVQKGRQGIGVNSNFIDNAYDYDKNGVDSDRNGDGDGEVLKVIFDKPVTSLDLYIDQLDEGEVGKYSLDEGLTWRTFDGTSTGASSGSDEAFTVTDAEGASFGSVWFTAMEGSDYSILATHISATWIDTIEITETTTTTVHDTLMVSVIDDGGDALGLAEGCLGLDDQLLRNKVIIFPNQEQDRNVYLGCILRDFKITVLVQNVRVIVQPHNP